MKVMATDNSKAIKELLEIVNNKVGNMEARQHDQSVQLHLMRDQQSVINEKLDDLKKNARELNENVDAARGDIELLHMDVKGIKDKESLYHSRNKREIDEIKTHLDIPLMSDIPEV